MQRCPFHKEETPCRGGSLHGEEALSDEAPNRVVLCTERIPFAEKVSCTEVIDTERRPLYVSTCREETLVKEAPHR